MKYLIGIDSGTQSTRAFLFDEEWREISKGSASHLPLIRKQKGWAEQDPKDIWMALCKSCKQMMSGFKGNIADIAGLCIAAQSNTICFMSKDGEHLAMPASYQDARLATGLPPMPEDTPAWENFQRTYSKANWYKANEPEIYAKVDKFVSVSGFLNYMLTDQFVDTVSNQVGHWPLDRENWRWEDRQWVYDCVGMRRDQLPEVFMPGKIMATVSAKGASATGLPVGIPVIAGARDKQMEALGAGAIHDQQGYITLGTSAGMAIVSTQFKSMTKDNFYYSWLSAAPYVWNYETPMPKGFWLVSWFRDNLGKDLAAEAKAQKTSIEDLLNREAAKIPAGSEGLVIVPEWQAARARPNGKGAMIGFDDRHTRAHMYRALLEGIFYQLRWNGETIMAKVGCEYNTLCIGGGGSRSDLALQIAADIFGMPVTRAGSPETCSLGGAMCTALGVGLYKSCEEAVSRMSPNATKFEPNMENHKLYNTVYEEIFKKLYPSMEPFYKKLNELFK